MTPRDSLDAHPTPTLFPGDQRFQAVFEQAAVGILQTDMDYRFVLANQFVCDMLGYAATELLQKTVLAVTFPDDQVKTQTGRQRLLDGEISSNTVEKRYLHKDGHIVWVRVTASLVRTHTGEPAGFLTIVEDITQRKLTEDALRETQEQHRLLFETAKMGVVYQNTQGEIIAANSAAQRILGLTLDQMQGRTSFDPRWHAIHEDGSAFPGDTHPAIVALQTGQPVTGVVMGVLHPQENAYHWLSVNAVPQFHDGENQPYVVAVTFEDITERQQMEQRTRATLEALLRMARLLVADGHSEESHENVQHLLEITHNVLGCSRVGFISIDPETEMLHTKALAGDDAAELSVLWQAHIPRSQYKKFLNQRQLAALRKGQLVHSTNIPELLNGPLPVMAHALLAPILVKGVFIGYLMLDFNRSKHTYSPHETALATAVANLCSLVLEREQLITDRTNALAAKQASEYAMQELLRQSEQRAVARAQQLEAIFEAITDAICVYDQQGTITQLNGAIKTFMEPEYAMEVNRLASPERMRILQLRDKHGAILDAAQSPDIRALRGEVLTGDQMIDTEMTTQDGRLLHISTAGAPIRDADGEIVGAVTIMRNVTEQHRREQRTQQALNALLAMAEAMTHPEPTTPDTSPHATNYVMRSMMELFCTVVDCQVIGMLAVVPETNALQPLIVLGLEPEKEQRWWDDAAHTTLANFAWAPRLAQGEFVTLDLVQDPIPNLVNLGIRSMLVAPVLFDDRLIAVIDLQHHTTPHHYTSDELELIRGIAKLAAVVLERERLQQAWEAARTNELTLRETNRRMDQFLSIASHEIRTPLTHFKGGVQLAQRRLNRMMAQGEDDVLTIERQQLTALYELLAITDGQTNRMTRLVGDLLDVSRVQLDALTIRPEPCDVGTIVRNAVATLALGRSQRTVDLVLPADPILVEADAERIGQVLMNFLTNAIKYSPDGSPIAVLLDVAAAHAHVAVSDIGPGVPLDQQVHIWERFYRVQGTNVTNGSDIGLGLGLYLSRAIIHSHHGEVGVISNEGAGATFWFTLPLLHASE